MPTGHDDKVNFQPSPDVTNLVLISTQGSPMFDCSGNDYLMYISKHITISMGIEFIMVTVRVLDDYDNCLR